VKVGLDSLDVMLRHDLTESRIRFLAAVLSENVQRANFNPIEEANGLRAMLDLHDGNQSAAAKAMGKSKAWFNQRIGLLRLTDEMVQLVLEGKLTAFRDMRRYASLPADEQYAAWQEDQERPRNVPAQPPVAGPTVVEEQPQAYTAVYAPASPPPIPEASAPAPASETPSSFTAVKPPAPTTREVRFTAVNEASQGNAAPAPAHEAIPEQRADRPAGTPAATGDDGEQAPRRVPWENPGELVLLLDHKVEGDDAFFDLFQLFGARALERDAARLGRLAQALAEQAAARTT
jgi:ParB family chromosome partitioning protein